MGKQCQRWRRLPFPRPEQGGAQRRRVQGAAAASGSAAVATAVSGGAPTTIPARSPR